MARGIGIWPHFPHVVICTVSENRLDCRNSMFILFLKLSQIGELYHNFIQVNLSPISLF